MLSKAYVTVKAALLLLTVTGAPVRLDVESANSFCKVILPASVESVVSLVNILLHLLVNVIFLPTILFAVVSKL